MQRTQIETWYAANRQQVVQAFAGKYGSDTVEAEDALQDVVLHLLGCQHIYKRLTIDGFKRLMWTAIDNRLKSLYTQSIKRRQREGNFARGMD